jgi:hypothetical protein
MRSCLKLALLLPLWFWSHGASALTTLTYYWSDASCGIVEPDGAPTVVPCSSSSTSFGALVQPGHSVFVTATLNYTYHDDGLTLAQPSYFQADPSGFDVRVFDHEAGALTFFLTNACSSRYCSRPPHLLDSFNGPYTIVLGDNDVPDDLSGELTVTATSGIAASWFVPENRTAFFVIGPTTFEGVTPAPEPATYALMLAGLAMVSAAARRRRRG